jgi:hypothetical protein
VEECRVEMVKTERELERMIRDPSVPKILTHVLLRIDSGQGRNRAQACVPREWPTPSPQPSTPTSTERSPYQ